jgi:hypothetical protein
MVMQMHNHHAHIDTRLHRPVISSRDTCNGSCEQACGCLCSLQGVGQGRGPVPKLPPKSERKRPSPAARFVLWFAVGLLLTALGWHALAALGSGFWRFA